MSKTESNPHKTFRYRWTNNHGTVLAVLACAISVVGFGFIGYRQWRFVKPKFPDGNSISRPGFTDDVDGSAERELLRGDDGALLPVAIETGEPAAIETGAPAASSSAAAEAGLE